MRREDERRRTGLPVTGNVVADLMREAGAVGVAFPRGFDASLGAAA